MLRTLVIAGLATLAFACGGPDLATVIDAQVDEPDAKVFTFADAAPEPDAPRAADAAVDEADAPPTADARVSDARVTDAPPPADAGADAGPIGQACLQAPPATQVLLSSKIYPSETYAGATDVYKFVSNQCSDEPDSAERFYTFQIDTAIEWYAETRCGSSSSWDCELVLTRDGCGDPNVVGCETTPGDEIMTSTLQPGKYALFVEGDNPEDPAVYDLMINFHHTDGQAACASTTLDVIKPSNCTDPNFDDPQYHLALSGTTTPEDVDDFYVEGKGDCTHDDAHVGGGPDKVYKLVLPEAHHVEIDLETDWDALLYVTTAPCGARDKVIACSDDLTGSTEEFSEDLAAGTYYVIIDGFGEDVFDGNGWGPYNLDVRVYDDICNE